MNDYESSKEVNVMNFVIVVKQVNNPKLQIPK